MATQVSRQIDVESIGALRLGDVLPNSLWAPYRTATPSFVKGSERASDGDAGDGNCINGAMVALAFEAVAAFVIYGIWQFVHLLR